MDEVQKIRELERRIEQLELAMGFLSVRKQAPRAKPESMAGLQARVLGVVRERLAAGDVMNMTGVREAYELRDKRLAGVSRANVRATVAALLGDGRLAQRENGTLKNGALNGA